MPELPEVETVLRGLSAAISEQTITRVTLNRDTLRWPIPADFVKRVTGRRVNSLARLGKYILVRLNGGDSILLHLGMSGRIRIGRVGDEPAPRHEHVVFETAEGSRVGFVDPRRFGAILLLRAKDERSHPLLAGLGVEPLSNELNSVRLESMLVGRKTAIKSLLLDQRVIAGLGNIYVCEVLFRAGVHPERPAGMLSAPEIELLAAAIPDVLEEAIEAGGSSLRDYVRTDGEKGAFQELHRVYGREHKPCSACPGPRECAGVRRIVQSGRSSFYCPVRQPDWRSA